MSAGPGLTAAMPGKVVKVLVVAGDHVAAGQTVLILESMKMETEVTTGRERRGGARPRGSRPSGGPGTRSWPPWSGPTRRWPPSEGPVRLHGQFLPQPDGRSLGPASVSRPAGASAAAGC